MDEDTKLRRKIHAAFAMHALMQGLNERGFVGDGQAAFIKDRAKLAVEIADAMIAELGPLP